MSCLQINQIYFGSIFRNQKLSKMSEQQKKSQQNKNQQKNKKSDSLYHQRLGNFYNFSVSEQKLTTLEGMSKKKGRRYFFTGIVFGFLTQYLLGNTKVYDNVVNKATMRRLNAKLKEDQKIGQIKQRNNAVKKQSKQI